MKSIANLAKQLVAAVLFSACVVGTASAQDATSPGQIAAPVSSPSSAGSIPGPSTAPLSPGDVIEYSVYGVPEMTQRVRLNTAGVVYLPLLNEVSLVGLNPEEAQKKLEDQLVSGGFLRAPHVTVTVTEYAHGISLLGEVTRPGVYPAGGARRLYDVLAAAGGLTQNAGTVVTISHSQDATKPDTVNISRDPSKAPEANVLVSPGDTIVVSKAGIVYVVGEVVQPAGFVMDSDQPMTVLKVIAMAHGVNKTAKLNSTKVIRKNDKGVVEIPVELAKIMSAKADDVQLRPDDIIFVPNSAAKSAAKRSLDTVLNMVTSLTVIRAAQ